MSPITGRRAVLCWGVFALITGIGCSGADPIEPGELPSVAADPSGEVRELPESAMDPPLEASHEQMAEDLAAGGLPLQFPAATGDTASEADDVADTGPSDGGLLEVLRQTVDLSPIFDQTGVQEGLSQGLLSATDELHRQKRENRSAIREANRQVRVGPARSSPNLVLISVEGLGYGDLGCYGRSLSETPHVDRLARRGLRFTNFYAGSARSQASRWCLMTGNNTGRAPVVEPGVERFTLSSYSTGNKVLPDVLWNSGYATALVGVWDEQINPLNYGYDQWSGIPATAGEFHSYPEVIHLDSTRARLPANSAGRQGVHLGEFLLQESMSFLDRHARAERPCFLHLALPEFEVTSIDDQTDRPASVVELDRIVGGLLDWMDEHEQNARTCVVLMGVCAPATEGAAESVGRTGELSVHDSGLSEGNLRVPLIVSWEGRIAAGQESEHVCAVWDVLPTLADLGYVMRRPQRLDGLSFMGTLLGRAQPEHRLLYWETREHGFGQAVRMGRWKGVRLPRRTTLALFDLATDPGEEHDLSGDRPEVVEQLVVRY